LMRLNYKIVLTNAVLVTLYLFYRVINFISLIFVRQSKVKI